MIVFLRLLEQTQGQMYSLSQGHTDLQGDVEDKVL